MGFITQVDQWAEKCISDPQWMADCLHRLYRFGGQHPESTVARHSLEVLNMCKHLTPAEQLWALVHDAHEILSGEITRHFKADETREKQSQADAVLRSALEIPDVDLLQVHCADIKHGALEFEHLNQFINGRISRNQLDSEYLVNWYGTTHEFVFLFEQLKGQI
jgi:hypothetical protein